MTSDECFGIDTIAKGVLTAMRFLDHKIFKPYDVPPRVSAQANSGRIAASGARDR